ncbi:uncharacterized protein [Cherax quadricarinatus]|uniref:uncharacterized protein n=1 Tax=Cherax quadricarinatus TaxID=27406 RepID=UPI00387EDF72
MVRECESTRETEDAGEPRSWCASGERGRTHETKPECARPLDEAMETEIRRRRGLGKGLVVGVRLPRGVLSLLRGVLSLLGEVPSLLRGVPRLLLLVLVFLLVVSHRCVDALWLEECNWDLGMESGDIPDEAITASSSHDHIVGPHNARLMAKANFHPAYSTKITGVLKPNSPFRLSGATCVYIPVKMEGESNWRLHMSKFRTVTAQYWL